LTFLDFIFLLRFTGITFSEIFIVAGGWSFRGSGGGFSWVGVGDDARALENS